MVTKLTRKRTPIALLLFPLSLTQFSCGEMEGMKKKDSERSMSSILSSHRLIDLSDFNFESEIILQSGRSLVYFNASWCTPCKSMNFVMDQVANETFGKNKVGLVNKDESPVVAQRYGITSVPTVLAIENGEVVGQLSGYSTKSKVLSLLE
ncbi:MAG: hypothetical protein RJB13_671 [Pseudomonadota bacterium]|jgi:thioredoxin 1